LGAAVTSAFLGVFALDATEERGQAVVVVLAPDLERMMVALGALHADAEEYLRRRLGEVLWRLVHEIERHRAARVQVALRQDQLAHHAIGRAVLAQRLLEPGVEAVDTLLAEHAAMGPQQIAPLDRPVIHVLGPIKQAVDQLGTLAWLLRGDELARLLDRGQ